MRHSKISKNNQKLFNNHNLNHDSKNHNHPSKITVGANEWRKKPQWIWSRMTRRKSKLVSVHVGHVKKKLCYVSDGSKTPRTAKLEPTEQTRQCARWTREEETLLCQCWVENSENGEIKADRSEDSFWGQTMQDFNSSTVRGFRTRHMLTGKWTRVIGDCQKFNAIYKHLERCEENEADHIETEKINFAAQQPKGRKFTLEHAWSIFKDHSKWDAPKPLDTDDHTEYLGLVRKLLAGTSAYEAKKQKELAITEFKEMEFLTIDLDTLSEPKASIIRKKQEKIITKYNQQ
ncbi:hypothetical protein Tco_0710045 [Tanacetum coccineum]